MNRNFCTMQFELKPLIAHSAKLFEQKKEEQCSYTVSLDDVPPRWDFLECGAQFLGEALLVCSSILPNFLWTASALFPVYCGKHGPWVCLPPEWRFNGKMMINHWISGYTFLRQTHMMLSSTDPAVNRQWMKNKSENPCMLHMTHRHLLDSFAQLS